jgi:hypothetical protein
VSECVGGECESEWCTATPPLTPEAGPTRPGVQPKEFVTVS